MLSNPQVTDASLAMKIAPAVLNPITDTDVLNIPLSFSGQTFIRRVAGTYSPNNDLITPIVFNGDIPTWMLVLCDAQLNVMVNGGAGLAAFYPVSKLLLVSHLVFPTSLVNVQFDGRLGSIVGNMPQASPVNYTIYYGDGSVA